MNAPIEAAKGTILGVLEELRVLAGPQMGHRRQEIAEIRRKLVESQFTLAVLGQFKRGKTTFINALLGEELLPTGIVPLTSIATLIRYGPGRRCRVFFRGGETREASVQDLEAFVTERGNPRNEKGVDFVEVFVPFPLLRAGVVLVDTPGIGSTFEHNTETARQFLHKVDVGIFLLSVDPPITREECGYLSEVRRHVDRLFFVLNKIDYASEGEVQEAANFCRQVLSETLRSANFKVYPLSARLALRAKKAADEELLAESRFATLENDLLRFVATAGEQVVIDTGCKRSLHLLRNERFLASLQTQALLTPLNELKEKQEALRNGLDQITKSARDWNYLLAGEEKAMVRSLEAELETLQSREEETLAAELNETYRSLGRARPKALYRELQSRLATALTRDLNVWRARKEDALKADFGRIRRRCEDTIDQKIREILDLAASIFSVSVESWRPSEDFVLSEGFDYRVGMEPVFLEVTPLSLSPILPSRVLRSYVLRRLQAEISEEANRNCGRLRSFYAGAMKSNFEKLTDGVERIVAQVAVEVRETLSAALTLQKKNRPEVSARLSELEELMEKFRELEERLMSANSAPDLRECPAPPGWIGST